MRKSRRARFKMADPAENVKIECRSKRAISSIVTAINEHIEHIVSGNPEASDEDKERCRLRFREVRKLLQHDSTEQ